MSSDSALYESARATFFLEAAEMLQQMEDALLALESEPGDSESINALFRAIHTIKGSAGLFGLSPVVEFTHQLESVLERLRNGALHLNAVLSQLLLHCCDICAQILRQCQGRGISADLDVPAMPEASGSELNDDAQAAMLKLKTYLPESTRAPHSAHGTAPEQIVANASDSNLWRLSLHFGTNTFRNGFDPIAILQYLQTMGELIDIRTLLDSPINFDDFCPETCYFKFHVVLHTLAKKTEIESVFEFVSDDCTVQIHAPRRRESDGLDVTPAMADLRIGDLLVELGAVSRTDVDMAVAQQQKHIATQQLARHTSAQIAQELTQLADNLATQPHQPIGEILVANNKILPATIDAALSKQSRVRDLKTEESRFLRVPADKLDSLINLVGEMVVCGASASVLALGRRDSRLIEATQQMMGLVEALRNSALALRMVQMGETFARFRRVVHDTAASLNKQIHLQIEGAETELDKSVVEKIGDPLLHLVRNAMDHGIESPQERERAGKPAQGVLRLSAHHDSGNVVIRVSDDGRGLDGNKLLEKAKEKGLVGANQTLTEAEKLNLIFEPGFSTAEKITNLSGRGVGMDVVKRNIEALRGKVLLKSELGKGMTIEIRLPLTLAIIDGFLVKVGKDCYVIPLDSVVECIDASPDKLHSNGDCAGNLYLRGQVLPYVELSKIFSTQIGMCKRRSIVVVKNDDVIAGLLVDQLIGEHQTVIKPLGKFFQQLRGVSGSTVLGSGEVALILDVPALVKLATERDSQCVLHMEDQLNAASPDKAESISTGRMCTVAVA